MSVKIRIEQIEGAVPVNGDVMVNDTKTFTKPIIGAGKGTSIDMADFGHPTLQIPHTINGLPGGGVWGADSSGYIFKITFVRSNQAISQFVVRISGDTYSNWCDVMISMYSQSQSNSFKRVKYIAGDPAVFDGLKFQFDYDSNESREIVYITTAGITYPVVRPLGLTSVGADPMAVADSYTIETVTEIPASVPVFSENYKIGAPFVLPSDLDVYTTQIALDERLKNYLNIKTPVGYLPAQALTNLNNAAAGDYGLAYGATANKGHSGSAHIINLSQFSNDDLIQLELPFRNNGYFGWRTKDSNGFYTWKYAWHTGNFNPANYATTAEFDNIYDQLSAKANTRLSNVVSDLSEVEKSAFKEKIGVLPQETTVVNVSTANHIVDFTAIKYKNIVRLSGNPTNLEIRDHTVDGAELHITTRSLGVGDITIKINCIDIEENQSTTTRLKQNTSSHFIWSKFHSSWIQVSRNAIN